MAKTDANCMTKYVLSGGGMTIKKNTAKKNTASEGFIY